MSHGKVRIGLLVVVAFACAQAACSRKFYRHTADREADGVIADKNCYDAWKLEQYHVYPDDRARFGDPTDPDHPPKPPDDQAARCLAPNPQKAGRHGCGLPEGTAYLELIANWDTENRTNRPPDDTFAGASIPGLITPPKNLDDSRERSLRTREHAYLITLDQACDLALINSREFQDRREDLFLAALPVTLERFAFAAQFLATEEVIREYTGRQTPEGQGNRWRANTTLGVSKLFCTGAMLVFRFANQVVVNMTDAGGPRVVTPSSLSLDFTQPLLQSGGKAVTLEPLTQTERNLVYVMRSYARFRKEFYAFIAAGTDFGTTFAPGSPLSPSGTAPSEGYYPTVLRDAILDNSKLNVLYLESIRALFRALLEGGDVSQLQVDQVELQLLNVQASVLSQTQQLSDALDRFKLQLGVPTSIPIELDDATLRPLIVQQRRFLEVVSQFDAIRGEMSRTAPVNPEDIRPRLQRWASESPIVANTSFLREFTRRWGELLALTEAQLENRLKELRQEKNDLFTRRAEYLSRSQVPPPELEQRSAELDRDLDMAILSQAVRSYGKKPWLIPGIDPARQAEIQAAAFRNVLSAFTVVLGEARNERIETVKLQWPTLPEVRLCGADLITTDLDQSIAAVSQTALANRLDLMNARAQVVDSWRQIAVRANGLMGVLDVRYHLDASTSPTTTQPFNFEGSRNRHQLIFNGELPLVRQLERNEYRTALIAFQRSRRSLQSAEDNVLANVRSELRQLRVLSENYKIQQRAVELSYYQVENSLNVLQAPPRPVPAGAAGSSSTTGSDAGTQAALTQQLLTAVSGLLQAQNQLYTVYQSYLIVRVQLYRDLELMPLDARGVWIDEHANTASTPGPDGGVAEPRTQRVAPPAALPELLPPPGNP